MNESLSINKNIQSGSGNLPLTGDVFYTARVLVYHHGSVVILVGSIFQAFMIGLEVNLLPATCVDTV